LDYFKFRFSKGRITIMDITQEHLKHVRNLGYKVISQKDTNARGVGRAYLRGQCPFGHIIKSEIRKTMQIPTCKQCYFNSMLNTGKHIKTLKDLGYKVNPYTKKIPSGANRTFIKGTCPNSHKIDAGILRFMLNPHCQKCGDKNKMTIDLYVVFLQELGYKVEIVRNSKHDSPYKSAIIGTCPNGHAVNLSRGFVPNPRCNECYNGQIREKNLRIALDEGYKVKIILKEQPGNNSPRTYFLGKCPNRHDFNMRVVDFISGRQRCSTCKKDAIIARVEQTIAETDYNLKVERVASKSKDRDTRLYVVGTCPKGHKISMPANNFEKGARCKGCVKYGFSTGRSAVFYLIEGSEIKVRKNNKAKDGILKEPILKYGVFHPGSGRLMIHGSRGFNMSPLFSLYHQDSKTIAELEKRVGNFIGEQGIKTCKELGFSFDGATESFLQESLATDDFIVKIKKIAKELEIEYDSKFERISTKEALIIGDRSKSIVTKKAIAKTVYKLDARKTDKQKIVNRSEGYARV